MALILAIGLLLPFYVPAGPFAGAFRLDDTGRINWYFATTALLRSPQLPEPQTRRYLNAFIAHVKPDGTIDDLAPAADGTYTPVPPDSEDAYASTFLSLATRYVRESHDRAWWRAHRQALADLSYRVLLTRFKPNGLIRVAQANPTAYLMDNVEDYAGLRDYAAMLEATHDPLAGYVRSFVGPLGAAIEHLYDDRAGEFRWADTGPLGPLVPYPSCAAQLFPPLAGVSGGNRRDDARHAFGARETAGRCRFSLATSPDESLLYALFIERLHDPSRAERAFLVAALHARELPNDIETRSLHDALTSGHPI
jgi:hypothetical protein